MDAISESEWNKNIIITNRSIIVHLVHVFLFLYWFLNHFQPFTNITVQYRNIIKHLNLQLKIIFIIMLK